MFSQDQHLENVGLFRWIARQYFLYALCFAQNEIFKCCFL